MNMKLKKMREWVIANPNSNCKEFMQKTGGNKTQFYNLRYVHGVSKKRNKVAKNVAKVDTFKPIKTVSIEIKSVVPSPIFKEFDAINKRMAEFQKLMTDVSVFTKQASEAIEKASKLIATGDTNGVAV